jgi:predicted RND superfamily exporter protein
MSGKIARRYAEFVTTRSKLVVLIVLLATVVVAAGTAVNETGDAGIGQFEVDSPETDAADYIEANYTTDDRVVSQIVVREENALSRESLLAGLRLQQEIRANESLEATLADPAFLGVENLVGTAAVLDQRGSLPPPNGSGGGPPGGPDAGAGPPAQEGEGEFEQPSLDEQVSALEDLSDEQFQQLLARVLDPEFGAVLPGDADPYDALPTGYTPGETTANARLITVFQTDDSGPNEDPLVAYDAQVTIDGLVEDRFDDAFVFGQGISDDASSRAVGDSFAVITPFALILVLFVLGVAYRDAIDILLGFVGIAVVLAWLSGIMAWLDIPMNQVLIAVPFLLIGLSIDYALHVVMRYREAREGTLGVERPGGDVENPERGETESDDRPAVGIRTAMGLGLGSVVLALAAATFSTGVGFLSNVVSPLPAIQDFAILSAGGILATFVAFGILLPALKTEVDGLVENRLGWSRRKPAFGVESGRVNSALGRLTTLASRAPLVVIGVALVLAAGGALGATTIDTEFNQADFLPQDPPDWTENLPGPFEPGTYTISDDFDYLSQNFQLRGEGGRSQILIRGTVTDGRVLGAIDSAAQNVTAESSLQRRPDGTGAVRGPHTVIRETARENATVAAAVQKRDTDGDGLPDEDLDRFYTILFDADEESASEVVSRENGTVTSARLLISVQSAESAQTIAGDTRAFGDSIEQRAPVTAVATGATVTTAVVQDALLETLVQAFIVTLVVILLFVTALFWVRYRSATLGPVVLAPVVAALCWLLGAMALVGLPFNSETGVITSLAIGLGVDYSIHTGERFVAERERRDSVEAALRATLSGTGGALLASAATTAAGFGVLALALAPPLRRFGIVTGSAIVLALVSCLLVLPSLLVVRERLLSDA